MKGMEKKSNNDNLIKFYRVDFKLEAILDARVTAFGTGGHIIVPSKYKGKDAKVIIISSIETFEGKSKNNKK